MKTKEIEKIESRQVTVATRLEQVLKAKEAIEIEEQLLRDNLMANLKEQGVQFVRLDNGTTFTRSHRETLKVKDEEKATNWAMDNNCMKIDTGKAMKILRRELKMPRFFTRVVGEDYLTVKYINGKEHED